MTDSSKLEQALKAERKNSGMWKKRAAWHKAEAEKQRGKATALRAELRQAEHKSRALEADLARMVKAAKDPAPTAGNAHRDTILALAETAGRPVTVTVPGQMIADADGNAIGMTKNVRQEAVSAGVTITPEEAEQYQIPAGTPGIHIVSTSKENTHE